MNCKDKLVRRKVSLTIGVGFTDTRINCLRWRSANLVSQHPEQMDMRAIKLKRGKG